MKVFPELEYTQLYQKLWGRDLQMNHVDFIGSKIADVPPRRVKLHKEIAKKNKK